MKEKKPLLIAAAAIVVILIAACLIFGNKQNQADTAAPTLDPVSLYSQAIENIQSSKKISYYVATEQITAAEGQEFTRVSHQRLNIQNPGEEAMQLSLVEVQDFGALSVTLSEYYKNGRGYLSIGENGFTSPVSGDEFIRRYAPADCFDHTLYKDIQYVTIGGNTVIFFRQPSAAEDWSLPSDAVFSDASGYAILNTEGVLKESVYTVSYEIGTAKITKNTKILMTGRFDLTFPENTEDYISIEHFDAPILLEQACGYLLQAETVNSSAQTNIHCQTFSIHRTQKSSLTMCGSGKDLYASVDVQIDQINQSRGGEATHIRQIETFKNGTYSICVDGTPQPGNQAIDASAMRSYCGDMLVGNILLPKHIAGVTAEETDSTLKFTFQASKGLAEAICSDICNTLYNDSEVLHALSSDYETQSIQCYLTLDKYTGLPLSFSSEYSASHTIEEISYQLESKTEQSYQYAKTSG